MFDARMEEDETRVVTEAPEMGQSHQHNIWAGWLQDKGYVIVLLALCLGTAVRIRQYLSQTSYWYDEAYLLVNIADKSYLELWGPLRCDQAAPPLFLWSLRWLYVAAGSTELVMRLPALLASLLTLPVFVALARSVAGKPGWLWGIAFVAFSQHAINHGIEVKPYAFDLLFSTSILLAASSVITAPTSSRKWRWSLACLYGGALLGPTFSYPSVFILGGASLALAVDIGIRPSRSSLVAWIGINAITSLSVLAVWFLCARQQRSQSLEAWWQYAFIDLSSPSKTALWIIDYLVKIGNYGTSGLGVPLLILGCVGLFRWAKQSPSLIPLFVGPVLLPLVPNLLRLYPLDGRLLMFAAPCLWLSAATCVSDSLDRVKGRAGWLVLLIAIGLILPSAVRASKALVVVKPKVEFREAFSYVKERESPADLWWVSHPEVAEVYMSKTRTVLGSYDTAASVIASVSDSRLWLITCLHQQGAAIPPELVQQLHSAGHHLRKIKSFSTIEVYCSEPRLINADASKPNSRR